MARKKTRAGKGVPASKAAPKSAARPRASEGTPGSDVERRWKEYWGCRKKLEDAVSRVKTARDALQVAQEAERSCRAEFEGVKRSLTTLLDVEPAGGPQRQPTAIPKPPSSVQGLPAPASGSEPKPVS